MHFIPGCRMRCDEDAEILGIDDAEMGEFAYDYVEVRRDFLAWTPAKEDPHSDAHRFIPQHGIEEHQNLANTNDASAHEYEERCYKDTTLAVAGAAQPPLPPHVYELAAQVYLLMRRRSESQAVVFR